jgi:predicted amidohydrolase
VLAARSAEAIVNPRATEAATWERWKPCSRHCADDGSCAVGESSGRVRRAPWRSSIVVGPNGDVMIESTDPLVVATLDRDVIATARSPIGLSSVFSKLYADAERCGD